MMDSESRRSLLELRKELSWLEANHPDKTELASIARGFLDTIKMAGSCESFSAGPENFPGRPKGGAAQPMSHDWANVPLDPDLRLPPPRVTVSQAIAIIVSTYAQKLESSADPGIFGPSTHA